MFDDKNVKLTAIVLSAGKGLRMGGDIPKQYMNLCGKPVLYYSLKAFEDSIVDEVIIVCGIGDEDYIKKEIVEKYGLKKVVDIVHGGRERYNSVYNGICAADYMAHGTVIGKASYIFIHDGARPMLSPEMIEQLYNEVKTKKAVIAACHAKDTVKIADENGLVISTPERSSVWQVQTPQVFEFSLLKTAYDALAADLEAGDTEPAHEHIFALPVITDDAMVVERYTGAKVYLCDSGYGNIKITTPEDILLAKALLGK